jgi:hypothetical protein
MLHLYHHSFLRSGLLIFNTTPKTNSKQFFIAPIACAQMPHAALMRLSRDVVSGMMAITPKVLLYAVCSAITVQKVML